jgi:hypothetical protein
MLDLSDETQPRNDHTEVDYVPAGAHVGVFLEYETHADDFQQELENEDGCEGILGVFLDLLDSR